MQAVSYFVVVVAGLCCLCQVHGVTLYRETEKQEGVQVGAELPHNVLLQLVSSIQLPPSAEVITDFLHRQRNATGNNGTDAHDNEVFVDAGELVIIQRNTSDGHKQDALVSLLLAQLAADYKYNRINDSLKWINDHGSVLGQVGWVLVKESIREIKLDEYFVISALVLDQVSRLTESTEVACDLKRVLNSFDGRIHEEAAKVFYNKTYGGSGINLAVSIVDDGEDGSLNMVTVRLVFNICEPSGPYLFHLFEPSCVGGKVQAHIEQYTLNEGNYSKVRKAVVRKLGSRVKTFVIKLSPLDTV